MSWVLFLGDLGLIGYLTMRAYKDGMIHPSSVPDPYVVPTSSGCGGDALEQ